MEKKKYEYLVTFRHLSEVQRGETRRWNAAICFGVGDGVFSKVARTEEEARNLVRRIKEEYPVLDIEPKDKTETSRCGSIGISIVRTSREQIDDQAVDIRVERREVTDWETLEDFE